MLCIAQVHLLLCLDQYSRWNMDCLSRDVFLFLKQSQPLQLADWPGYTPRRGLLDGSFPTDRSTVYTYELQLPPLVMRKLPDLQSKLTAVLALWRMRKSMADFLAQVSMAGADRPAVEAVAEMQDTKQGRLRSNRKHVLVAKRSDKR